VVVYRIAAILLLTVLGLTYSADAEPARLSPISAADSGAYIATAQASPPTLTLVAPAPSLPNSAPFELELRVTGAAELAGFELDLQLDASLATLEGVTLGQALDGGAGCNANLRRCAALLGPLPTSSGFGLGAYSFGTGLPTSGDQTLAVLRLRPTGVEGTLKVEISNPLISSAGGVATVPSAQGVSITLVGQARPTPSPTTTPIPTATPKPSPTPEAPDNTIYMPLIRR
jgi:hypothetical protein